MPSDQRHERTFKVASAAVAGNASVAQLYVERT